MIGFENDDITRPVITDIYGRGVSFTVQPATRGPIMIRFKDAAGLAVSIYDLFYSNHSAKTRIVPINRDYSTVPTWNNVELFEHVPIRRLDREYRKKSGPGRKCTLTLKQTRLIYRYARKFGVLETAKRLGVSPTTVAQIHRGKTYWYLSGE